MLLERCEDEEVRRGFDRPSSVLIRNVKITRELVNPMFLRLSRDTGKQRISPVEFRKLSPTRYTGSVNVEFPSFMVFAETFHSDWVLTLEDGKGDKKVVESKFLADLYANAWYIEEPGSYQFELEFVPQKRVNNGLAVSVVGGLTVAFLVLKERRKK